MTDVARGASPLLRRDGRVDGKVALVTGGGGEHGEYASIGAAIATLLALNGASVVILDHDEKRAAYTCAEIAAQDGVATAVCGDAANIATCEEAAQAATARYGGLDIVVNSAAINPTEHEPDDDLWRRVIELNLRGPKVMTEAAVQHMARRGGGSVINISSTAGLRGGAGVSYSTSKAGLVGLTRAMAYTYGRDGIRVNCVAPGHVHTPMGATADGARRLRAAAGLLGSEGNAWDVAYAVLFLASDEARWITGVVLPVDAGTTSALPLRMFSHMTQVLENG